MRKTGVLILAGGRGRRMDVLCHVRPKPALSFAGRFKVIDFTLSNCVYSEINELAILTDYQRSFMANYLRQWGHANGDRTLHILEPDTGSYNGTADAVYQNLSYLNGIDTENVLILAGDHIYKMDYREMIDFHEQTNAAVTVGVIRVPIEEAHRFGTVSLGEGDKILDFVEKTSNPRSNLASMGIYVFNKEVLSRRLQEDALRPDSLHDFGYSILPGMVGRDTINAYEFTGYWQDIGTPQAYYAANMEIIRARPSFSLNHSRTVLTQRLDLPLPVLSHQGTVTNSLLSPGCVIKGRVENSILSPGVYVDEQAEVRDSILMTNACVGYHSIVDTCVIDEDVNIRKLCCVGFGTHLQPKGGDITVLGKGVAVPSHTAIGRNCTVFPNVDISGFGGKVIVSGSILSQQGSVQKKLVEKGGGK